MKLKNYILIVGFITIFTTFGYGQSPDLGTVCAESIELYGVDGAANSDFIWAVSTGGAIVDGDGTDTITIQWGYNIGDYLIEVVEVSSSGCMGTTSSGTVSVNAPQIDLGYDFYEICDGDSVIFDATGNYLEPYTVQWHDSTYSLRFTASTQEKIVAIVTDGLGCVRMDSLDLTVHDLPSVSIGNDTILCDNTNPLSLDAGNDFALYEWERNNEVYYNNPFLVYPSVSSIDTLLVTVTDMNGCENSDTILILPCDVLSLFNEIPNTITPNNDGMNDEWIIPFTDQFPQAILEIFDRWGRLVWRTEDVAHEFWDGSSNGKEVPMDTYYFTLNLNYMGFEGISGTINVIR